jgi:hypothetical protein
MISNSLSSYSFLSAPVISIPNDCIACDVPVSKAVQMTQKRGFAVANQVVELLPIKVVYGNSGDNARRYPYMPGDTVWIRGDSMTLIWTKERYQLGDKKVILVPCSAIQAWEAQPQAYNWQVQGPNNTVFYAPPINLHTPSVLPAPAGTGVAPLVYEGDVTGLKP